MSDGGFKRVAILGLGLMGGSIAAGLKQRGHADLIVAWDRNSDALSEGLELGMIDEAASDITTASDEADIVVLAVPVQAVSEVVAALSGNHGVLTDVGSVKRYVLDAVCEGMGAVPPNFVPGHPIAGSEKHGVSASDANLFEQHRVILTPLEYTDPDATRQIELLWQGLGARTIHMTPDHHDDVLAQTSHLPHLLAYALVDTLSAGGDSLEVFQYAAGGFRDFSRIAASDPVMWRDIFMTNPGPVLEILDRFQSDLEGLRRMIEEGDASGLKEVFARAKQARDHFSGIEESRRK